MSAPLALGSAAVFGTADFLGGTASRRSTPLAVTATSQAAGLVWLAILLPILPGTARAADIGWGALAGIAGATGLLMFFAGMAAGPISLVSPLAAVTTAIVPFAIGLARGERPAPLALGGAVVGLTAIALTARRPRDDPGDERVWLPLALGAGVAFGAFFVLLSFSADASGQWPLLGARLSSVTLFAAIRLVTGRGVVASGALAVAAIAGVLDISANALFLLAVRRGALSLTAVLVSLFPVVTIVLARLFLRERLVRHQRAAVAFAIAGAAMIAAS